MCSSEVGCGTGYTEAAKQADPPQSLLQAQMEQPTAPYQPPLSAITEAQKYSKYAASSLGFEDIPTAVKYLQQALDLLRVQARLEALGLFVNSE